MKKYIVLLVLLIEVVVSKHSVDFILHFNNITLDEAAKIEKQILRKYNKKDTTLNVKIKEKTNYFQSGTITIDPWDDTYLN